MSDILEASINAQRKANFLILIFECVAFIGVVMFFLMNLWINAPISTGYRMVVSVVAIPILYDIFKTFIHTKWVLLKSNTILD